MKFKFSSSLFLFAFVLFILGLKVKTVRAIFPTQALLDFSRKNGTLVTKSLKDEHEEKLKKWHMECFHETKVDPELVARIRSGKWQVNNRALKNWVLCVLNKYDLMSMEGVFRLDTALSLVPRSDWENMEATIDSCLPTTRSEPHEIAWKYAKCYHMTANDPKNEGKRFHYMTLFY